MIVARLRRPFVFCRQSLVCTLTLATSITMITPVAAKPQRAPSISSVEVRNGSRPGAVTIYATRATSLAPDLMVERQELDKSFKIVQDLDLSSMHLTTSCGLVPRTCVRADASGLRIVPWTGMSCSAQCQRTCDKNEHLHGTFRFVVVSCDRKIRYEGSLFHLP